MKEITTTVEIADSTGHTTLQLTKAETLSRVSKAVGPGSSQGTGWFSQSNWLSLTGAVGTVRIVPGLQGGL